MRQHQNDPKININFITVRQYDDSTDELEVATKKKRMPGSLCMCVPKTDRRAADFREIRKLSKNSLNKQ